MNITGLLLVSILFPFLAAVLVPLTRRLGADEGRTALFAAGLTFVLCFLTALYARAGFTGDIFVAMPLGLSAHFAGDGVSAFMACAASFLSFIIMYYSQGYIKDSGHKAEYYAACMVFLGAMTGLVYSVNLAWIFVFWEITAICSWRLVGYFRAKADVAKANKTF
ncbi:MAG: hypothetical protein LBR90_00750, partial [Elusimicrobiota bacterium]|nr:hypothetical protein [Elusimicrobiota bacterium]